ncbi:unnamed protein product [Cylicocyclus nassatus]|uniref:Uncharacterized protein n=1 Tax=Cylicocyclus nassatus TaxID=53992 RepID=A0AA36GLA9_CYLNA|nr:unnamed protein product [Cylicocyclus nassatus]
MDTPLKIDKNRVYDTQARPAASWSRLASLSGSSKPGRACFCQKLESFEWKQKEGICGVEGINAGDDKRKNETKHV